MRDVGSSESWIVRISICWGFFTETPLLPFRRLLFTCSSLHDINLVLAVIPSPPSHPLCSAKGSFTPSAKFPPVLMSRVSPITNLGKLSAENPPTLYLSYVDVLAGLVKDKRAASVCPSEGLDVETDSTNGQIPNNLLCRKIAQLCPPRSSLGVTRRVEAFDSFPE